MSVIVFLWAIYLGLMDSGGVTTALSPSPATAAASQFSKRRKKRHENVNTERITWRISPHERKSVTLSHV